MIKKLKKRLIIMTMLSVFALLAVLVIGMNLVNYSTITREADRVLHNLADKQFLPPDPPHDSNKKPDSIPNNHVPGKPIVIIPSETRYFSVIMGKNGEVLHTDLSQIGSVDADTAMTYAENVYGDDSEHGFLASFRYIRLEENGIVHLIFLDCGRQLDSFKTFLNVSMIISAIGLVLVLLVFSFASSRIIRPIAESYEKQKRFVTDAGHEIKTPLTIIGANVDILEMETGANESLDDIRQQTKRLTGLTNDLVLLARMEESEHTMPMIDFPLSETVRETSESFRAPALAENKTWICDILPMLTIKGNDKAIRRLVSVLLDNALKYSPQGGTVNLRLFQQGHTVVLTVFNTTSVPIDPHSLDRIFDRFYRTDPSRNSQTGGHGIGLSIAQAIVHSHGGKITASSDDPHTFCITVTLPM